MPGAGRQRGERGDHARGCVRSLRPRALAGRRRPGLIGRTLGARRRALGFTAVVLLLTLGRLVDPLRPRAAPVQTSLGPVEVLDGDTLRLPDGRRVRLAAVDTPERGRPGAQEATARVRRHLAGGRLALVPPDPPLDRYGRLLADVEVDGISLSALLVQEGLAWVYMTSDPELVALQAEAVQRRLGVHARLDCWRSGLLVITPTRFHRADCPSVRRSVVARDVGRDAAALLKRGLSPCRTCLPWPP